MTKTTLATRSSMSPSEIDIERLDRLAHRMDSLVRIPGTQITIGLDAVLGLIPGVGDVLALLPSIYIFRQGHRAGVTPYTKGRMITNIAIDAAIGSIPLVGDLFDIGFKSKIRNVALIREHLDQHSTVATRDTLPHDTSDSGSDIGVDHTSD